MLSHQVNDLLERQLVEEAVLLAETIAAVEASRNTTAAEEVTSSAASRLLAGCWRLRSFSKNLAGCQRIRVVTGGDGIRY